MVVIPYACICAFLQPKLQDYFFDDPGAFASAEGGRETKLRRIVESFPDCQSGEQDVLLHHVGVSNAGEREGLIEGSSAGGVEVPTSHALGHHVEH